VTIATDALMMIKGQLCDRIDMIARELPHMSITGLMSEIDDIRRTASHHDLVPLAELAHGLESALASSRDRIMIMPYLDIMRDAIGCDRSNLAASQIYLTIVNQRLYG
jgi:hypothetical protein